MANILFTPDKELLSDREGTITTLGFQKGSLQADVVRAMTDAFFVAGMERAMDMFIAYMDGKISKDELAKLVKREDI